MKTLVAATYVATVFGFGFADTVNGSLIVSASGKAATTCKLIKTRKFGYNEI
ncbi:MAG: hypothetical protein OXP71_02275 [Candidatus Poribacteria bacterium]|nr:hypothetical protein [Candidatus Poribacteria bacterium]